MSAFQNNGLNHSNMYNEELARLIEPVSTRLTLKPKEIFSSPDTNSDSIFFIREGRTKHYICTSDGSVKVLFFLNAGWIFGETTYFLSRETGIYAQAHTDCVLFKFDASTFDKLLAESVLFRDKLLECLSHKSFYYRTEIENLTFHSCGNRLKSLFCSAVDTSRVIDGHWYGLKMNYSHAELGEIIGATRVTISRLLSEFSKGNFCRSVNHQIQINREQYLDFIGKHRA